MSDRRLDLGLIAEYNATRVIAHPQQICHAPFNNIYFNVRGQGAPCWLTFFEAPSYPENPVHDIWFGSHFENIRQLVRDGNLSERCMVCERNIKNRLFMNPLAKAYDNDFPLTKYPQIMEFELSNFCNLECQMCNGRLSSSIRKNRDLLPVIDSPYDSRFIDQLTEFLPHLKEVRCNGGEPFLQKLCWELWEKIVEINDQIEITVATNGTVWTPKVEDILQRAKFRVNLSLDGFSKQTYESIRRNSNFERVIANAAKFGDYCRRNDRIFSIMVNPMRMNWHEMPLIIEFCNQNGYHIWFNTVYRPFHMALWNLPSTELNTIYKKMSAHHFPEAPNEFRKIADGNNEKYRNLVQGQIATWLKEQIEREQRGQDYVATSRLRENSRSELGMRLQEVMKHPENLELAWKKLNALESKVSHNVQANDLYHWLGQTPIDWLMHDLEHKSLDEMAENVYYRVEYY